MLDIAQVETDEQISQLEEISWEYLSYVNENVQREYQISFDIRSILAHDMTSLNIFAPLEGCMYLAQLDGQTAGMIGLRKNKSNIGELKRMYVRPTFRRKGIARALVETALKDAHQIGYTRLRLDSTRFMQEAHALYRSVGFCEIEPYEGSEIPKDFQPHWVFMELTFV